MKFRESAPSDGSASWRTSAACARYTRPRWTSCARSKVSAEASLKRFIGISTIRQAADAGQSAQSDHLVADHSDSTHRRSVLSAGRVVADAEQEPCGDGDLRLRCGYRLARRLSGEEAGPDVRVRSVSRS